MNLVMPGEMDGVATTRVIKQTYPETQIIALTSFKERELIHEALQAWRDRVPAEKHLNR
jgi:DNA-binding NarL/FixJ family response regulator